MIETKKAILIALFFAAPGATATARGAEAPKPPRLDIDAYRLDNGLKVALQLDRSVPRVTVTVAYHVGSKDERPGKTGFAHFFEHMMFRGTKHVPNYDIPLQETGAQTNAFTSEDMTVYYETVPSHYLRRALYLEAERLAFLPTALNQKTFDTERQVVKNERRQSYENVPYGLAEETILAKVFPKGETYSWSVIGSMKDLDAASLDDLKAFFLEYYHPGNATLSIVGDFEPTETRKWIREYFGSLAEGPRRRKVKPPGRAVAADRTTIVDRVEFPRVEWAWPTVAEDHPDTPALEILATVLAGGDASRLHKALVLDAKTATDVSAAVDAKELGGYFALEATASETGTVEAIEAIFDRELDRIRREGVERAEVDRALARFEKSTFAQLTSPLGRAIAVGIGYAEHDDPNYVTKEFLRRFKVKPEDVKRVADEYLTKRKIALVVRPASKGEEKTPAVSAGPDPKLATENPPKIMERSPKNGPDWTKMPGPGKPSEFHPPAFVHKTLSNGIDVYFAPWRILPIATARVLFRAGTADDSSAKQGLATLTATLLDKGTKDKTATELAEAFELLGVSPSVSAGVDHTTVALSAVVRNIDESFKLMSEMLSPPRFDPNDFARERNLQLAEIRQGPNDPNWIAQRAFRKILFREGGYAQPPDGTAESVKRLTVDDVKRFYDETLSRRRVTVVIVGDLEEKALFDSLETTLGRLTLKQDVPLNRASLPAPPGSKTIYLVDKPSAAQSVIRIGRPWVKRKDPRYFAALIGNHVLGEDFLSRLNNNLREEHGYTYGAMSRFDFRAAGSVWLAAANVFTDVTAPALKEMLSEIDGVAKGKPLTDKEIETARQAIARSWPEKFESPSGIAAELDELALFDLPENALDVYLDLLRAPTADEVRGVMELLCEPRRGVLVVGDRSKIEPALKKLDAGEIRVITMDGKPVDK